jgi:hypothetical protein
VVDGSDPVSAPTQSDPGAAAPTPSDVTGPAPEPVGAAVPATPEPLDGLAAGETNGVTGCSPATSIPLPDVTNPAGVSFASAGGAQTVETGGRGANASSGPPGGEAAPFHRPRESPPPSSGGGGVSGGSGGGAATGVSAVLGGLSSIAVAPLGRVFKLALDSPRSSAILADLERPG